MFYYASTTGTSGNTGTIGSPWDLATALANGSQTSGDTLYLRNGTYTGKWTSSLGGGTVMSYPGEWAVIDGYQTTTLVGAINNSQTTLVVASATGMQSGGKLAIDSEMLQISSVAGTTITVNRAWDGTTGASHSNGATVIIAGNQLQITGNGTTYKNFEVTNSWTTRNANGNGQGFETIIRGSGVVNPASDLNIFTNLIIHDNHNGFFIGSSSSNTTVYGCLIYNNGFINPDSGHGIYTENSAGYSRIYANVILNNFHFSGQFYGVSGPYVGGDIQNNAMANAGAMNGGVGQDFNFILGPNAVQSATASFTTNYCFQPYASTGGVVAEFGYGAGIASLTATGNYFVGGPIACRVEAVDSITFTGNKLYANNATNGTTLPFADATRPTGTWNSNTYYNPATRDYYGINGTGYLPFSTWKSTTGYDAGSTQNASDLPDTVVVVPNVYETGRANVIIYAHSAPSTINVNLSTTGLTNGQTYTIKNAFDYNGTAVTTGTYNSGAPTITVSMSGAVTNVASPTGLGFTPATTAPDFAVLVIIPTSSAASAVSFTGNFRLSNVKIG